MTIKELETILELPRATIRYYEQEGLIAPSRRENSYREYSQEDLQTLERVRLLRALGCSVAQIRDIQAGRAALSDAMEERGRAFAREQQNNANAQEVCEDIRRSAAGFADLDARRYLSGAWRAQSGPIAPVREQTPRVSAARRFWARMLDMQLYAALWDVLIGFVWPAACFSDAGGWQIAAIAMTAACMLLLEPALLHWLGTTPGKWILGLRVVSQEGARLTLAQARSRTWGVLWHGLRLNVPVIKLRGLWKSYREYADGATLAWEYDSDVVQRDAKKWRTAGYIGLREAILLTTVCCIGLGRMAPNRGELSEEQYIQNYNWLNTVYALQAPELGTDVTDVLWGGDGAVIVIDMGWEEPPEPEVDVRHGVVCGVQLCLRAQAGAEDRIFRMPCEQMALTAMALCTAQSPWYREMGILGSDALRILEFCTDLELPMPGEGERIERMAIGRWTLEFTAQCEGSVYSSYDGGAIFLRAEEDSAFSMALRVFQE